MNKKKGKLFVVEKTHDICVFSFDVNTTNVINHKLKPGVYLLVIEYNEIFGMVLNEGKVYLTRLSDIESLILD